MTKLTDNAIVELHDAIQSTSTLETLSISVVDDSNIVGTVLVDSSMFNVTAKVLGPTGDAGIGQPGAQVFTILCGVTASNGTLVGNIWRYEVAHPFNGNEYVVSIIDSISKQELHADVIKQDNYAIISIAQQALHCYDVTFVGYVA